MDWGAIGVSFGAAALAGAWAAIVTPLAARLAIAVGLVDRPRSRHQHDREIPLLGGPVIASGMALTLGLGLLAAPTVFGEVLFRHPHIGWLSLAAVIIVVLGVIDDAREVSAAAKLAVQIIAASIVVIAGYGFVSLTNPLTGGQIQLGVLGPAVTIGWIVLITNAFNLIDGLDGLAAGVALIAALTLIGVALLEGRLDAVLIWSILAGCLLGFLPFNFPPASVFLGDSGSLLLGFTFAVFSVQSLQKGATTVVLAVPVLALGLPISDAAHAMARRWRGAGGAAILRGDREHIHHRLVRSGWSVRAAVLLLYASCMVFSALAFMAVVARGPVEALLVAIAAVAAFLATRELDRNGGGE